MLFETPTMKHPASPARGRGDSRASAAGEGVGTLRNRNTLAHRRNRGINGPLTRIAP